MSEIGSIMQALPFVISAEEDAHPSAVEGGVRSMDRSLDLLEKARHCRRLAQLSTDVRTISVLIDTAESYEREAKAYQRTSPPARPYRPSTVGGHLDGISTPSTPSPAPS